MIGKKKINPLNVLDIRKVEFCPPYFETAVIDPSYNIHVAIDDWIYSNCSGRYYIGTTVEENESHNGIKRKLKIGFEESKELTYFMLACPYLKY
mgnify:CR=1 FL=1